MTSHDYVMSSFYHWQSTWLLIFLSTLLLIDSSKRYEFWIITEPLSIDYSPTDSAKVLAIISLKRNLEETCCVILRVHNDHHDSHVYFHQMVWLNQGTNLLGKGREAWSSYKTAILIDSVVTQISNHSIKLTKNKVLKNTNTYLELQWLMKPITFSLPINCRW